MELARESQARELPRHLRLFKDATPLGGVESLIEWRRRHDPQASPTLLRLSVGLEEPRDLIEDLQSGLEAVGVDVSRRDIAGPGQRGIGAGGN